jgi:hypothetical protein
MADQVIYVQAGQLTPAQVADVAARKADLAKQGDNALHTPKKAQPEAPEAEGAKP